MPDSYEKLTTSSIRSSCSRLKNLSSRKSYLLIIIPNSHEKLTKGELSLVWRQICPPIIEVDQKWN